MMPLCDLSAASFGLPQSRQRVYFLMVRKDLASQAQVQAVAAWVKFQLTFSDRSDLKGISKYVEVVTDGLGDGLHFPYTAAKDCLSRRPHRLHRSL